jgi:hypothetical protein
MIVDKNGREYTLGCKFIFCGDVYEFIYDEEMLCHFGKNENEEICVRKSLLATCEITE